MTTRLWTCLLIGWFSIYSYASSSFITTEPTPTTKPLDVVLSGTNFEPILRIKLEPNGFGGQVARVTWDNPTAQNWYMYESIDSMKTWPWRFFMGTNTSTIIYVGNQQRFFQLRSQ